MSNRKIIDYTLLKYGYPSDMEIRVKKLLSEGWELYGNISSDGDGSLVREMVKYEPTEPLDPFAIGG